MWNLFGRKRRAATIPANRTSVIARKAQALQRGWADWMQRESERLSLRRKKVLFVTAVVLASAYCVILMTGSLLEPSGKLPETGKMRVPTLSLDTVIRKSVPDIRMQHRIHSFRQYMDSLGHTSEGRYKRDSILKARPGLMDSIALWEKMKDNNKK